MDTPRFRFGSGSRPVASASHTQPLRRDADASSSTGVNDLLGKLRLEQGRHRRNVLQRQIKANVKKRQDEEDYETVNLVVDGGGLATGIDVLPSTATIGASSPLSGRLRTPGPRAPDSWKDLAPATLARTTLPSSSQPAASDYGNGRKWSADKRRQMYSLWAEQVLKKRLHLDDAILPTGLELWIGGPVQSRGQLQAVCREGVQSLVSQCLTVLAQHLDSTLPDGTSENKKESSWLTTDDGKMTLRERLRLPLMVHAAYTGSAGWRGMFELFEPGSAGHRKSALSADEDESAGDWDDSDSENDGATCEPAAIEALPMLDLSFVPLPSSARRRFREMFTDPLNLANLTSISFAGCGLAMEDIVDVLCRGKGGGNMAKTNALLGLRLKDLSLAGVGARDQDGRNKAVLRISTSFTSLEFLDMSYTRTFPNEFVTEFMPGMTVLAGLFSIPSSSDDRPRLPALKLLGFRDMIPRCTFPEANKAKAGISKDISDLSEIRRLVVLDFMRHVRKGRYVDVIFE